MSKTWYCHSLVQNFAKESFHATKSKIDTSIHDLYILVECPCVATATQFYFLYEHEHEHAHVNK
jgi:hypothetical protein